NYGLKLRGKNASYVMERGTLIHAALATYYNARKSGVAHIAATLEAYKTLNELAATSPVFDPITLGIECFKLLAEYFDFYGDEDMEVLAVETEYLIPITDDFSLQVRIDLVKRQNGRVIVEDHKVLYNFYSDKKIGLEGQLPLYLAGLRTEGFKVDEVAYNMIRHRGDAVDRFRRQTVPITAKRVVTTLEEHLRASNRIASLRAKGLEGWRSVILRNAKECDGCPYTLLCEAELNGQDTRGLIEYEYAPKTHRQEMNV
ncbi:MAG TPA: PD-(D/E)XK nuclease family protein, partial [Methylococcales bacterium]